MRLKKNAAKLNPLVRTRALRKEERRTLLYAARRGVGIPTLRLTRVVAPVTGQTTDQATLLRELEGLVHISASAPPGPAPTGSCLLAFAFALGAFFPFEFIGVYSPSTSGQGL